ncbi:GPP34 family phosphoprotein [Streptomyces violaceorubidus]|uniref:GPP34 family phosphoprotein n=1 Tax=Streptomyces violaceorubidus TaxID=284042 RepID=UPI0004BE50F4|nr:GPP34 family phosphoprotein [Streptomyces violaceorubidus]
MSTARELTLITLALPPGRAVEQGDLSLALAGAEAADLLADGRLSLDGDRMVPGEGAASDAPLLEEAFAALVRLQPRETVEQWLWRRGEGLAEAYAADLHRAGLLVRPHGRGLRLRSAPVEPADSPQYRHARERLASGDPVLAGLMVLLTAGEATPETDGALLAPDDAVNTVLAAVGDAVTDLEAARLRRDVEEAAFDNIWRA